MNELFRDQRAAFKSLAPAFRWPLITLTLMIALALAGSFVPYDYVLSNGHPWLPPKTCMGCALCGMTRAFCAMSAGRWNAAADWNSLGPATYALFWTWIAGAGFFAVRTFSTRAFRKNFALALRHRFTRKPLQNT